MTLRLVIQIGWVVIIAIFVAIRLADKSSWDKYVSEKYRNMPWKEKANSWPFMLRTAVSVGIWWTITAYIIGKIIIGISHL